MIKEVLLFGIFLFIISCYSSAQNSIYLQKDSLMVLNVDGLSMILYYGQVYDIDSITPDYEHDRKIIRSIARQVIGKYNCIEICKTRRNEIIYEIEKTIQRSEKMVGKIIHYEITAIDVDDRIKEAFEKKTGKDPFIK